MDKNGGSRLMQMQARFQQRQLQERELKITSLYEAQQARALDRVRHSPISGSGAGTAATVTPPAQPSVPVQPGKVRQMFEERRTKAGIDKSYPLQPIHNTDRPAARKLTNGHTKVTSSLTNGHKVTAGSKVSVERKATRTTMTSHSVRKQHKIENIVNGSGDLNHNHEPDMNSDKQMLPRSNGEMVSSLDELDKAENNYLIENETFPEALAPTATPRSPEPQTEPKRPPRRSPATNKTSRPAKANPPPVAPPRRVASERAVPESSKPRGTMQRASTPVIKRQPVVSARQESSGSSSKRAPAAPSTGDGVPCAVCGRRFASDRLAKHQDICKKTSTKKRKPFDVLKHRLAGTEAEPFIGKLKRQTVAPAAAASKPAKQLNNNWRQKHEEFIQAIRAAKQVQAHLAAGGKLSDLPPPPPSENPDYVQCPHCNRRFNQAAAERHIPKCSNYQYNKPKPAAKRR